MSRGWLTYAQSLVRLEQPVGVVLREHEMHSAVVDDTAAQPETTVTESRRGDVTRLLSADAGRCRAALERPLVELALRGRPLSVLFDLVMQDPAASSRVPQGIVGGTVGGGASSSRAALRVSQQLELRVNAGDTLEQALDRLVSTGLPFGWGVIEHDETSTSPCTIILFTEENALVTPYDALLPPAPLPHVPR